MLQKITVSMDQELALKQLLEITVSVDEELTLELRFENSPD